MSEQENKKGYDGDLEKGEKRAVSARDILYVACFVLVIAAIFVINAMEAGSYRTPWLVAIVVTTIGLGLLVLAYLRSKQEKSRQQKSYSEMSLKEALAEPERNIIRQALKTNHWNRQATAKALKINRTTLFKKMKHYGLYAEAEQLGLT